MAFNRDSEIQRAAQKYGADPHLMMAIADTESGPYGQQAVSSKGAVGFMQLMPGTAEELGVDPNDPVQNIHGGVKYFSKYKGILRDDALTLAAYNAGPGNLRKAQQKAAAEGRPDAWLEYLPEETQQYVPKVLAKADSLRSVGEIAPAAPVHSEQYLNYKAWEVAAARLADNPDSDLGTLFATARAELSVTGPDDVIRSQAEAHTEQTVRALTDEVAAKAMVGEVDEAQVKALAAWQNLADFTSVLNSVSDVQGIMADYFSTHTAIDAENEYSKYANSLVNDMKEGMGLFELLGNSAANVLWNADFLLGEATDIARVVMPDAEEPDFVQAMVALRSMDPKERADWLRDNFNSLAEAVDNNPYKVEWVLSTATASDPEFNETVQQVFGALDIAGVVPVGTVIKGVKSPIQSLKLLGNRLRTVRENSVPQRFKDLGREDVAGDLLAEAGVAGTKEAESMVAGGKVGAAQAADPMNAGNPLNGHIVTKVTPSVVRGVETRTVGGPVRVTGQSIEQSGAAARAKAIEDIKVDLTARAGNALEPEALAAAKAELDSIRVEIKNAKARVARSAGPSEDSAALVELEDKAARLQRTVTEAADAERAAKDLAVFESGKIPPRFRKDVIEAEQRAMAARSAEIPAATRQQRPVPVNEAQRLADELELVSRQSVAESMQAIRETGYIDAAMARRIETYLEDLQKKKLFQSAVIKETSPNGFKVEYTVEGRAYTEEVEWGRDMLGHWEIKSPTLADKVIQTIGGEILSPEVLARKFAPDMVKMFTFAGMQNERVLREFTKVGRRITESLTKEQASRVNNLLVRGDTTMNPVTGVSGVTFSARELLAGAVDGIRYSPEEVQAYFQLRQVYDDLWQMQNEAVRKYLQFQGMREVQWIEDGVEVAEIAARVEATAGDMVNPTVAVIGPKGKMVLRGDDPRVVTALEKGQVLKPHSMRAQVDLTDAEQESVRLLTVRTQELEAELQAKVQAIASRSPDARGMRPKKVIETELQKAREAAASVSGRESKKVDYIIVAEDQIKDLRQNVLHYREGYIPRFRERGLFYVKDQNMNTVMVFDGRNAANEWAAKNSTEERQFVAYGDNELSVGEQEHLKFETVGGLFTRPRTDEPLRLGETMGLTETADVFDATARYMGAIARMLPLNEYRSVVIEQFQNAVATAAKMNGRPDGFAVKGDWTSALATGDPVIDAQLTTAREYILQQLGMTGRRERILHHAVDSFIDMMEGKTFWGAQKLRSAVREASYEQNLRLKSLIFHPYMGFFNLRQLPVQATNATIAATMYPQHALKAFSDTVRIGKAIMASDEDIIAMAKAFKEDPQALLDDVRAFRRSGMVDSIMRTGDAALMKAKLNQSVAGHLWENTLDKGLLPYQMGEGFSRLMAWNVAKYRFLAKNPGRVFDDAAVEAITQDALRINMNLNRENAAAWQNNPLLGIPTMFLQVQAKFLENAVGGLLFDVGTKTGGRSGWTRAEAARVVGGISVMYGLNDIYGYAKEKVGEFSSEVEVSKWEMDNPGLNKLLDDGAFGYLMQLAGFNTKFGEDLSLIAGMDDTILTTMYDFILGNEEISFSDVLGPGQIVSRYDSALAQIWQSAFVLFKYPEKTLQEVANVADSLASITSTWSNYSKVRMFKKIGAMYTKSGALLDTYNPEYHNQMTLIARALGFETTREYQFYDSLETAKDRAAALKDAKDYVAELQLKLIRGQIDPQTYETLLFIEAEGWAGKERQDILMHGMKKASEGASAIDKQNMADYKKFIESGGKAPLPDPTQLSPATE